MKKNKILVFGSNGLVGKSLIRIMSNSNKVTELVASNRADTNLFSLEETKKTIEKVKPNIVINAAAKVGGIYANNTKRSDFIIENLKINLNILEACIPYEDIQIINLGSSCIYPLNAENPINENSLLTGKLEPTNSPYAVAKIAAIEIGRSMSFQHGHNILNIMPTNLYGPEDNFSENDSHVIPGLISRMHKAKINNEPEFQIWGSGKPLREFLYVDDLANAIEYLINKQINEDILNVGSSKEISIINLSELIKEIIGYPGNLVFNTSMPDGNPRKLIDSSKIIKMGWKPKIKLEEGIKLSYEWFLKNHSQIKI
jgi:GDP-L-fucose synthase